MFIFPRRSTFDECQRYYFVMRNAKNEKCKNNLKKLIYFIFFGISLFFCTFASKISLRLKSLRVQKVQKVQEFNSLN